MTRAICLYLHVHQPYRVRNYTVFEAGADSNYFFMNTPHPRLNNEDVIHKVAHKSYLPMNEHLMRIMEQVPEFRISMSITGTLLEQLEMWSPETLESFKRLVATGRVEIVAETYFHSLAFFFSRFEFEKQVRMHREKIKQVFNVEPRVFRNTELSYNNDLAYWADKAGYKGIITEGWDKVLDWRSPNFVYKPAYTENIRLLMKNYHLSDDLAFRFSDKQWAEYPLTAEKYTYWLNALPQDQDIINLFMDYETFGEHQWADSGIFDFLDAFPHVFISSGDNTFMTISDAIDTYEPKGTIDVPQTITWADTERDLTAWLGNSMQQQATKLIYELETEILTTGNHELINDWRRLQTSDHFYYMCTKWFKDGDVHAYFSPYESPYDGFIDYMNVLKDLRVRIDHSKQEALHG
jgi:alpha-amylase